MDHSQNSEEGYSLLYEPWVWIFAFILCILIPPFRPVILFLVIVGAVGFIPLIPLAVSQWKEDRKKVK